MGGGGGKKKKKASGEKDIACIDIGYHDGHFKQVTRKSDREGFTLNKFALYKTHNSSPWVWILTNIEEQTENNLKILGYEPSLI